VSRSGARGVTQAPGESPGPWGSGLSLGGVALAPEE
jgi:hypothetical protein